MLAEILLTSMEIVRREFVGINANYSALEGYENKMLEESQKLQQL